MSQQKEAPLTGEVTGRGGNNVQVDVMLACGNNESRDISCIPFGIPVENRMFHIYTASIVDGRRETQRQSLRPLTWESACRWVRGVMSLIGQGKGGAFVDCVAEPIELERPWTLELRAAFDREMTRLAAERNPTPMELENRELRERLKRSLTYVADAEPIFTSTAQVEAVVGRMFAPRQEIDCIIENVATLAAQVSAERLERDTHLACAVRQVLSMREVVA